MPSEAIEDVMIIAIGGPTCSGKTTLAKNLQKVLPNAEIVHQDDFAPSSEKIPIHPVYGVADWDDPRGAIEWDRLRETLRSFKENKNSGLPKTHDHLNTQPDFIDVDPKKFLNWIQKFNHERKNSKNFPQRFIILEGFLLYWDRECVNNYDLKFFVREAHDVLKRRRQIRQTYHTADGFAWVDPPKYWEQIIWPSYLLAHRHMFKDGGVEQAELDEHSWGGKDVTLLEPKQGDSGEQTITYYLETTLEKIYDQLKKS